MKKLFIGAIFSAMAYIHPAIAQNYSLQLSHPDKQAKLEVSVMNGSVTVQGYEGKTVEINYNSSEMASLSTEESAEEEVEFENDPESDGNSKRRPIDGLKKNQKFSGASTNRRAQ